MALEGNLSDFSLQDMFKLLESGSKSGELFVRHGETEGFLCFRDGLVFHASVGDVQPVASSLADAGVVTAKQLRQAQGLMKIQKKEKADRKLGQILVDEGYLEASVLEEFLGERVTDTLFELLQWEEGEIRFVPGDCRPEADMGIAVSVEGVLARVSERLEAWRRIAEEIPDDETRFVMAAGPGAGESEIRLQPREWAVLCHIHGGRSVRELAQLTGLSDHDAAQLLLDMHSCGLVEKAEALCESAVA